LKHRVNQTWPRVNSFEDQSIGPDIKSISIQIEWSPDLPFDVKRKENINNKKRQE
jgi:hypothetical protein